MFPYELGIRRVVTRKESRAIFEDFAEQGLARSCEVYQIDRTPGRASQD